MIAFSPHATLQSRDGGQQQRERQRDRDDDDDRAERGGVVLPTGGVLIS